MAILVIADHDNRRLHETTLKALTAASLISTEIDVIVLGENARTVAEEAAKAQGVRKVLLAEGPGLGKMLAEPVAATVAPLMADYDVLISTSTSTGRDVSPRIAAKLDVSQISDVVEVVDSRTFVRPIYAGNALETVTTDQAKLVLTIRPTAFKAARSSDGSATVEATTTFTGAAKAQFHGEETRVSDRPELSGARVVVAGGRALGSDVEFREVLEPLADRLGAAIGASRAAVDAGYAPNDFQVGQTGKVVAPDLYIAIGISGAIQHLAGMKDSKVIVAINKDPEAPIFQVADYGLVADYKVVVPALLEALGPRGGS